MKMKHARSSLCAASEAALARRDDADSLAGASGVLRTATLQSAMRADAQREEQYD
ncbi:MAG: hypothetical protein ACJ8LN_05610 [Sulfurifustis sp.]